MSGASIERTSHRCRGSSSAAWSARRPTTATLVPLRVGTGTKNKVLQSLAMARPVVTTTIGNEGMDAGSGQEAMVADDPAAFAEAVVRLHADPALRRELGRKGRAWVEA